MDNDTHKPDAVDLAFEAAYQALMQAGREHASSPECWQMMREAAGQFVDQATAARVVSLVLDMATDPNQPPND